MSFFTACFYDHFIAGAGEACLAAWRRELLGRTCGEVLEIGSGIGAAIVDAGFAIRQVDRESMRKALPIVRPTIRGIAVMACDDR